MGNGNWWQNALGCCVVVVCASGARHHVMRPRVACGLPDRNYEFRNFSLPVTALSFGAPPVAVLGSSIAIETAAVPAKLFQFREASLRSEHCSISQMAVRLHSNGNWAISLRADQNPRTIEPVEVMTPAMTKEDPRLFTEHFLRNQFFVRVRCYAQHGPGVDEGLLGKPVMVQLEAPPFWVQRGVPYPLLATGWDGAVEKYYNQIDRVAIEFFYRQDASQTLPVIIAPGGAP